MRFKICLALVLLLPLTVMAKKKSAKNKKAPKVELVTAADSASYALGVFMGTKSAYAIEQQDLKADIFARAYNDALFGAETVMTSDFASMYLDEYAKKMVEIENEARKKAQADFLAENKKRAGVVETASGLQYQVVKAGEGEYPTATSKVKVHYEGFLLDGTKFDSSIDRGKPLEFSLNRVIKGWAEGVALMQPGAKYTLYIPYQLGYGEYGAGAVVKPYSMLIFEVELLEIVSE
jgi:FKBP-type peptidyl-prolyl cis-trans isomerase FklB